MGAEACIIGFGDLLPRPLLYPGRYAIQIVESGIGQDDPIDHPPRRIRLRSSNSANASAIGTKRPGAAIASLTKVS